MRRHGLGIVTGLQAEANCLDRSADGIIGVFCAGGSATRAYDGALGLVDSGATALLSFGIGGGLDPELQPGTLVIADAVLSPDGERFDTDPRWRRRLEPLGEGLTAVIQGSDHVLATPTVKRRLHTEYGAALVDMESHGVAAAARDRFLPMMAIRAVADMASDTIPRSSIAAMAPDGHIRVLSVLARLAIQPWELPALIALGRRTETALDSLRRLVARTGKDLFLMHE